MSEEKSLEDFFKKESPSRNRKEEIEHKSSTRTGRLKSSKDVNSKDFFKKYFSFDAYADLKDPVSVLYRRNYCIKNIISLVNIIFLLFSFVGISRSNYIITIVFFLLMAGLSITISSMLKRDKEDYNHQVVTMYLISFYVFFMSVVLYVKIYLGFTVSVNRNLTTEEFSITQAAYFLMFFSLLIMSLYQEPKLIKTMFLWSFIIITIINLTLLHPELYYNAESIRGLFEYVFITNTSILTDIVLRTLVFLVYFLALYTSASLSRNINEKRKQEIGKREDVETKFTNMVNFLFSSVKVYNQSRDPIEESLSSRRIRAVAKELGMSLAYDSLKLKDLVEFSSIHADRLKELSLKDTKELASEDFDTILEKTELASLIMKRLEISKEAEDIVYSIFNGVDIDKTMHQKVDLNEEIILLSEVYDILRSNRSYKRSLNHERTVELILHDFKGLISSSLLIRLSKFNNDIKNSYERI